MSDKKDVKSTATISENAVLANDKRGFPFKKVFFALLVLLVIASIILLVVNAVIESYFSQVTVFDGEWQSLSSCSHRSKKKSQYVYSLFHGITTLQNLIPTHYRQHLLSALNICQG